MKKCPKCGYERLPKVKYYVPSTKCPDCGAIYEKNETYLAQKKIALKKQWERISLKPKLPKNLSKKPYILALTAIFILGFLFVTAQYVIFPYLKKQELDKLDKLDKQNCNKAYVALKKVEALLESGINYRDYGNAVGSVRIELNLLKGDSKRAEELEKIYAYYQLSKELWSAKVKDDLTAIFNIIESGEISNGVPIINILESGEISNELWRLKTLTGLRDRNPELYVELHGERYAELYYEPAQQVLWHEASGLLKDYEQK